MYLNRGDGTWGRAFGYLHGNSDHVFQFGDVDGDGHLDVATAKQEGTVWLGDGEGFFTEADGNLPPLASSYDWRPGPSLGDVEAQAVSLERNMSCGLGKCGHCRLGPYHVCYDGPVFTCEQLQDLPGAWD